MMRNEVEKALRDFKFDYVLDLIKELTREDWTKIKSIIDNEIINNSEVYVGKD
jgi:hypothetical protein